jgi:dienelactone hydrolase
MRSDSTPSVVSDSTRQEGIRQITLRLRLSSDEDTTIALELLHPAKPPSSALHRTSSPGRILLLCGPTGLSATALAGRGWHVVRLDLGETQPAVPGDKTAILPRWPLITFEAWRIRGVLDFLLNQPGMGAAEVALAGQGFGGKVALWTAAQDERVAAVLAVDSGPGGACPFRFWTEAEFGPGVEISTRTHPAWFRPELRFFVGREEHLPVDAPALLASLAPRPVLLATALNHPEESAWAVEQAWRKALPRFEQTGAAQALALDIRPGTGAAPASDWNRWLRWVEARLGLISPEETHLSGPRFPTGETWQKAGGKRLDPDDFPLRGPADLLVSSEGRLISTPEAWQERAAGLRRTLRQNLTASPGRSDPVNQTGVPAMPPREPVKPPATWLVREPLSIRAGLSGNVCYRTNIIGTNRRLPALIWLHPWSVPTGFEAAAFRKEQPWLALTRSGSVVLTFDQLGCGSRIEEGCDFSGNQPGRSLLGQMVQDARDAVSALARHRHVDPEQVFLLGCGLGGVVALHAAALDDRVAGVLNVAGFPPMRDAGVTRPNATLKSLACEPPLLPQLADFGNREAHLPWDFTDLLALIAPRPTLIVVPRVNRFADAEAVTAAAEAARPVYALLGNPDALVLQVKDDYNHFTPDQIWCLCDDEAQR